jgi:serine/threonine-protein kinase
VPPELDEICARAMAWNRDERYPSAGAMQQDLERYLISTGMNVTAREVGSCVSELFREDRANTNTVIEAHIARLRGGTVVREKLPIIDVASRSVGSPTPSGERAMTRPPFDPENVTSPDTPSARMTDDASSQASEPRRPVQPRRDLRPVIITAVAGVVVGIIVIFLVARLTHDASPVTRAEPAPPAPQALPVAPTQPTPPPAVVQAPPAPPAPPARPPVIDVEIRVSPATATVSIDGNMVDGNPFSKHYPVDSETHHVRAAAPGYVAKSVSVAFNANVTLDISLERLPPPPAPPVPVPARVTQRPRQPEPARKVEPARPTEATAQPAPPPPPPPQQPQPELVKPANEINSNPVKPRRPIDPSNPYENPHGGGQ